MGPLGAADDSPLTYATDRCAVRDVQEERRARRRKRANKTAKKRQNQLLPSRLSSRLRVFALAVSPCHFDPAFQIPIISASLVQTQNGVTQKCPATRSPSQAASSTSPISPSFRLSRATAP